jgi:glutathione synthase/RimK-type ligase-like ATP-grasp enzyme
MWQLSVAVACGARVPASVVTNSPRVARPFASPGRTIAKSVSAGIGIAPYAGAVDEHLIDLLPNAPTLLQELVEGAADLRVVVVDQEVFTWRRPRQTNESVDWRQPDPAGAGFKVVDCPQINSRAVAITVGLGLTFSVQDWVEPCDGDADPVFLEVNPVGQWLFLADAAAVVGAALARHLVSESTHA